MINSIIEIHILFRMEESFSGLLLVKSLNHPSVRIPARGCCLTRGILYLVGYIYEYSFVSYLRMLNCTELLCSSLNLLNNCSLHIPQMFSEIYTIEVVKVRSFLCSFTCSFVHYKLRSFALLFFFGDYPINVFSWQFPVHNG